ncbi:hypothetical protein ACFL5O_11280 [Myxococcota bacterium]
MSSIVLRLQENPLDKGVTVTGLLRKSFVAARKLALAEFQEWV